MRLRSKLLTQEGASQIARHRPYQPAHDIAPVYSARVKAYMDSGASISVTGDLSNLSNTRSAALRIQAFTGSDQATATTVGDWGPIKDTYHVPGSNNLISSGSMLDGTAAGIYSTSMHSFLVSGLHIGNEIAPGLHELHVDANASATKIATRNGPGSLYEADLSAIGSGLRRIHKRTLGSTSRKLRKTGRRPPSLISNLDPAINAQLQRELDAVKPKPPSLWYATQKVRHDQVLSTLFPQTVDNPWTNLPVLPRTESRAVAELIMFASPPNHRPHSKLHVSTEMPKHEHPVKYIPDPTISNKHTAIQHRLMRRHRQLNHPGKRMMQRMLELSTWPPDLKLAKLVRRFMPHCPDCMVSKQTKLPRSKAASGESAATRFLQRLFVDCSGL